ncbi:hypothetical protein GCM10023189_31370 [Nibrella saemangeumensis]|uniref:ScyD/ScyE family protein n=1 Tax=Nibrella saemangeumensis TaxID=1084526 RepID=A0ABP8N2E1_9BACT
MKNKRNAFFALLVALLVVSCQDHNLPLNPNRIQVTDFASGLKNPMAMDTDPQGRVWVAEVGTGQNDGQISVILPGGFRFPVVIGFPSFFVPTEPFPVGLNHFLYISGKLHILHANGMMYVADVSQFNPGTSVPLLASNLPTENIGQFVINHNFGAEDTGESNPYNMTAGPNGNLYIVDAAANAVIRRDLNGTLSVFATLPRFANPTNPMVGPPMIDPVPTGINYHGDGWFYVTTLTGFPFLPGRATVYRLGLNGVFSTFQTGFTTLVDVEFADGVSGSLPLVVQFSNFGQQGFQPNTGNVIMAHGNTTTNVVSGLNFPTDLDKASPNMYYINSMTDGTIKRITYQ